MKILMTTDAIGGVWNYSLDLCQALGEHGVEIHLAAMGRPLYGDQLKRVKRIRNVELHESDYKLEWMDNPWNDVEAAGHWLQKIASDVHPRLIHFNNYGQAASGWGEPLVVVAHSCVPSWWRAVKQEETPDEWRRYRNTVAVALKEAAMVVAPTHSFLREIENIYGPLRKKAAVYNARIFPPIKWKVQKETIIFSAGRIWDEAKNIKALTGIADRIDWPVYLAGSLQNADTSAVVDAEKVRLLGQIPAEEISIWMQRASIYALPAHYEPFGLTVLEAAYHGAALLLSGIPTFRELWDGAALFVNPRDEDQILEGINRLVRDDKLRENLGAKARKRALEFTPSRMAAEYFSIYREIFARGKQTVANVLTGERI